MPAARHSASGCCHLVPGPGMRRAGNAPGGGRQSPPNPGRARCLSRGRCSRAPPRPAFVPRPLPQRGRLSEGLAAGKAAPSSRSCGSVPGKEKALPLCEVLLIRFCFGSVAVVYLCVGLTPCKMLLILKGFWWCGINLTLGYF